MSVISRVRALPYNVHVKTTQFGTDYLGTYGLQYLAWHPGPCPTRAAVAFADGNDFTISRFLPPKDRELFERSPAHHNSTEPNDYTHSHPQQSTW